MVQGFGVPKLTLTAGDFGEGPAAADLAALHLPDPLRPGSVLVVPLTEVAEMAMVRSDNTNRIKSAVRTSLRGLLSAGPAGLSAGLLAAGRAPQTVFTVRLRDGRTFTALANAGDFADIHAAQVEAAATERAHPADSLIHRYLAERYGPSRPAEPVVDSVPLAALPSASPMPAAKTVPASPETGASFGRRRTRPA